MVRYDIYITILPRHDTELPHLEAEFIFIPNCYSMLPKEKSYYYNFIWTFHPLIYFRNLMNTHVHDSLKFPYFSFLL